MFTVGRTLMASEKSTFVACVTSDTSDTSATNCPQNSKEAREQEREVSILPGEVPSLTVGVREERRGGVGLYGHPPSPYRMESKKE
jgi:hypothetical protein